MQRTTDNCADGTGSASLPSQIAWLSLCLLAAGWGTGLDPTVGELWKIWGLLGLVSAAGLDVVWRTRMMRRKRTQQRSVQRRVVRSLTNLAAQTETSTRIGVAVRRIVEDHQQRDGTPSLEQRCDGRLSLRCTVRVTPLDDPASTSDGLHKTTFTVCARDISTSGVGLVHNQTINNRHVMFTFDLLDSESIALVAHLQWQHVETDGKYSSGWKFVEVRNPLNCHLQEALQIA